MIVLLGYVSIREKIAMYISFYHWYIFVRNNGVIAHVLV